MKTYEPNDVVSVRSREGAVDCVIKSMRRVSRGRRAGLVEYELAPLKSGTKGYAFRCVGETFFGEPSRKYTAEEVAAASAKMEETREKIEERKQERAEKGREAIGQVDWAKSHETGKLEGTQIKCGDRVLIKYSDCQRWETVGAVNFKTGKIGIEKPEDVIQAAARRAAWKQQLGLRSAVREYRWLPAQLVLKVEKQQRTLPFKLGRETQGWDDLEKNGWVQLRFGQEFIERSYVVAKTAELAEKGQTYECAGQVVYQDPETKLFWRDTGSFD